MPTVQLWIFGISAAVHARPKSVRTVSDTWTAYSCAAIFALCNHSEAAKFKRTCAAKYPQKRGSRREPPTLPGLVCASWPETIAARSAQLGYSGFRDQCAHQQFIEPQAIECATP